MALEETCVPLAEGSVSGVPEEIQGEESAASFFFLLPLRQSLERPDLSAYCSNVLTFNCRGAR